MINKDFFMALDELELEKGITKESFLEALESALVFAYKKHYGEASGISVKINPEKNSVKIYSVKKVVETVEDAEKEISLEDARQEKKNIQIGEDLMKEIVPKDFGRIAAQTAKQVIMQRLKDVERDSAFNEFSEKENEIVTCIVRYSENNNIFVEIGKNQIEGILMPQDQIKGESYAVNEHLKVYVKKVRNTPKGPQVVVSRTSSGLVKRLFENEVPEIRQGLVVIKSIARDAGQRTKIAIASTDETIDPIGACVGNKGVRVNAIVNELDGEKIDIIPWCEDSLEFIARALSPAEVKYVEGNEETKAAKVVVPDNKLSLAIGKEGQNARLAARLTGWKIDVKSESAFKTESEAFEKEETDDLNEASEVNAQEDQNAVEENQENQIQE